MAGPNQSKKETTGIELPIPPQGRSPDPGIKPRETARIELPLRESLSESPVHSPTEPQSNGGSAVQDVTSTEFFRPSGPPSAPMPLSDSVTAAPDSTSSQNPSIAGGPAGKNSMLLMWILLGVSALILIIQIWTYFS